MPTANSTEGEPGAAPPQGSPAVNTNVNLPGNAAPNAAAGQGANPAAGQGAMGAAGLPNHQGPNFGEVLTAIQAMPEKIVQGLREATQAAQAPAQQQSTGDTGQGSAGSQTATQTASQTAETTPTKKSFAERWFS